MPATRSWRSTLVLLLVLVLLSPLSGCGNGDGRNERLYPGAITAYPISSVLIAHEGHEPGESLALALEALEELRNGAAIADVARRRSEDPQTAARGGFLGFQRPEGESSLAGAIQVLPVGQVGGPLMQNRGIHILYRHTHEEGAKLEGKYVIPVYGFFVPWVEVPGENSIGRDEAQRRAEEALQKIKSGELGLLEAAEKYSTQVQRQPRTYIVSAWAQGRDAPLHEALKDVEPGEFAPVADLQGAFGVLKRGRHFRSVVRHIMVLHSEGKGQPPVHRTRKEAEEIAKKVLAQAKRDGANWFELVERYSDEEIMIRRGGTIGSASNGDLHAALEDVVLDTPPGQVADRLAESPDGFHVMWRVN